MITRAPSFFLGFFLAGTILFLSAGTIQKDAPAMHTAALEATDTFPVVLEPENRTQVLVPDISTRVVEINKKMGDSFKKGDLLIRFDNAVFRANLEQSQHAMEKTEMNFKIKKALAEDKLASPYELKEALVERFKARAEYEQAKKLMKETEIFAEYNGKVVGIGVNLWEIPKRDKMVIETVDDSKLIATFFVPSILLRDIKVSEPMYIWVKELNEIVTATVTRVGAVINPGSSTVKVEAEIDNTQGHWKSGMSGVAAFSKGPLQPLIETAPARRS